MLQAQRAQQKREKERVELVEKEAAIREVK